MRTILGVSLVLWVLSGASAGAADKGPLVDLDASDLGSGEVASWPNRGSSGGEFLAAPGTSPTAGTVGGRKAVLFGGPCLSSAFPAPPGLAGDHDFTLAVWACAERLEGKQVMVTWASRPYDCAEFAYGSGGEGAFCSWGAGNFGLGRKTPPAGQWRHIAFVHEAGRMLVYVDGQVALDRGITLKTKPREPIRLGAAWDSVKKQSCFPFPGALATVRIYDRALAPREVRNLAGRFEPFAPQPADGATVEVRRTSLAWQAGDERAGSFEVYVGHDAQAVADADESSNLRTSPRPIEKSSLGPIDLSLGKTYYWRVDQLDAGGGVAHKGTVWTFKVSAGPATDPQPRDRVAGVSRSVRELRWVPGRYTVTQDLYFGEDEKTVAESATPAVRALPADARFLVLPVPRLDYGKTYYWRVHENNGNLPPAKGEVWSFRTEDEPTADDVTFFVGSDGHYVHEENDDLSRQVIGMMNWLPGTRFPEEAGGDIVRTPRGVVYNGDLLDAGVDPKTAQQAWSRFVEDFGLTGERRLAFPVYEGFGNHDGGAGKSVVREGIRERNRRRPGLTSVSENGYHYSWDWDRVHLVQLNLFAGAGPEDVASVSPREHDPMDALGFLKQDLAKHVGTSGRAVVIFQHIGWPPDGMSHWWSDAAKDRFFEAVKDYNVLCLFHGHSHAAAIYQWRGLTVIADGSTARPEHPPGDFFVVRITRNEFIAAHRLPEEWGVCISEPLPARPATVGPQR